MTTRPPTPRLAAHVYPAGAAWHWRVVLNSASQSPRVAAGLDCASRAIAESAARAALDRARGVYAEWWADAPAPMGLRERRA